MDNTEQMGQKNYGRGPIQPEISRPVEGAFGLRLRLEVHATLSRKQHTVSFSQTVRDLKGAFSMYVSPQQSRPLSYAPTPYGYTPNISLSARINLDEEVKLADSASERDLVDSLAEIYSIIRTLDGLEKAYIKDALPESEYSEICSKLLKQYRSILSDETVSKEFVDLDTFCRTWDVRTVSSRGVAEANCHRSSVRAQGNDYASDSQQTRFSSRDQRLPDQHQPLLPPGV